MVKPLNNWYVVTGAPCSGKTATLQALEKKGFKVIYEAARIFIDQELAKGKLLEEIRKNEIKFQLDVLRRKIKIEKGLPKNEMIFFDRAIPDSIAYYNLLRAPHHSLLLKAIKRCAYKKVFLLQRLKYAEDYARVEDEKTAAEIEQLLEICYNTIGLPLIKVPEMPIEERERFILDNL